MNNYETIFIMNDEITEEQRKITIDEIKEYLYENAKISNEENLGKKRLAYEIRKHEYAYYYLIEFSGECSIIPELQRMCRTNEDILKFIIIKKDI